MGVCIDGVARDAEGAREGCGVDELGRRVVGAEPCGYLLGQRVELVIGQRDPQLEHLVHVLATEQRTVEVVAQERGRSLDSDLRVAGASLSTSRSYRRLRARHVLRVIERQRV